MLCEKLVVGEVGGLLYIVGGGALAGSSYI